MADKEINNKKCRKKRVLVIERYPIIREALTCLINKQQDLIVCGMPAPDTINMQCIKEHSPDILLAGLSVQEIGNLKQIKDSNAKIPALPILIFSMLEGSIYAARAFDAGAKGYIMKHEPVENILKAVRTVLEGKVYVSEAIAAQLLGSLAAGRQIHGKHKKEVLTNQELSVFTMIGYGMTTRIIAEKLCLNVKTIETYRARIKEKLGLKNAIELVYTAVQWVVEGSH